jgi:hypothetical protein
MERTVRGAFAKTMAEQGANVKCQFDHGYDTSVGSRVLCLAEELREDADTAVLEGDLFDTSYNRDLLPGIKAGAYGSSLPLPGHQGRVERRPRAVRPQPRTACRSAPSPRSASSRPAPSCLARTLTPPPGSAPSPTSSGSAPGQRDPQVEGLLARARELRAPKPTATVIDLAPAIPTERTSPATEAGQTTSEPGEAARTTDDEPATRHSSGYLPHQRRALIHPILSRKDTP